MSYKLENEVEFAIIMEDGKVLPVGPSNVVRADLIENTNQLVPTFHLSLRENLDFRGRYGLFNDGDKIGVIMSPDWSDEPQTLWFRIFSVTQPRMENGLIFYTINCYADMVDIFKARMKKPERGSASEVIKKVAESFGLYTEIAQTSDNQLWRTGNGTVLQQLGRIASRAWGGKKSAYAIGVTTAPRDSGKQYSLRMPDIMEIEKHKGTFYSTRKFNPGWWVIDFSTVSRQGEINFTSGYKSRTLQDNVSGKLDVYEDVEARLMSEFLNVNRKVKEAVGAARRTFYPIDSGNTHENFVRAYHQNDRLQSTYSLDVYVLTPEYTGLRLFDYVRAQLVNGLGVLDQHALGDHRIGSRTRSISGVYYREKLELCSQGPSLDAYKTQLPV